MAVQKRIIWVDDKDWATLGEKAKAEGKTISVLIRERSLGNGYAGDLLGTSESQAGEGMQPKEWSRARFGSPRPAPKGK